MDAPTIPELHTLIDDVKRQRDEVRVRLHLAKAEAKDEWDRLEAKFEHVRGKLQVVGREAGKAAEDVGSALRLAVEELQRGYQRVRQLL
jgi:predicted nuclease with TOPRIM domain